METERQFYDRIKANRERRSASILASGLDADRMLELIDRAIETTWKPMDQFTPHPGVFILVTKDGRVERGIWQVKGDIFPGDFDGFVITQTQKVRPEVFTYFFDLRVLWNGPGVIPHDYFPDLQAQGDCTFCGHKREAHHDVPKDPDQGLS